MGFVSLKYDFAFKRVMENEEVRKHFVSDVLGIPVEEIKSARIVSPVLGKTLFWQKEGVLDVLLILQDGRKVNIELQVRSIKYWDRRVSFYLARMLAEDMRAGEDYGKLKKCINISILDFEIDDSPEYHRVYRLRDRQGNDFTDLLEVHIIELRKDLGGGKLDDWIRLFNAKTEEELSMIKTENPGVLEAIREVRAMSYGKTLRWMYETWRMNQWDRKAREEYVRDEGIVRGENRKLVSLVRKKVTRDQTAEEIAVLLEEEPSRISEICDLIRKHPEWNDERICQELEDSL